MVMKQFRNRPQSDSRLFQLQVSCQLSPAFFFSGQREKYLARKQTAAIVIGIQHPHGYLLRTARFDDAGIVLERCEDDQLSFGTSFCASLIANPTCRCSSGACSGPNETTIRFGSVSFVSPSTWSQ